MLMLSVLSVLSGQGEASSGHHEAVLEMVRNIAMGLEGAESVAFGVEVTEMRAAIRQRRDLRGSHQGSWSAASTS
jgi:hypothetical protein